jgi:hypothetical protein
MRATRANDPPKNNQWDRLIWAMTSLQVKSDEKRPARPFGRGKAGQIGRNPKASIVPSNLGNCHVFDANPSGNQRAILRVSLIGR